MYLIYFSLVTFSRRYRAVLRACLVTFKKDDTDFVDHTDEYNQVVNRLVQQSFCDLLQISNA